MKIGLWCVGKDHEPYIKGGVTDFTGRISNYFPAYWNIIPSPKKLSMRSDIDAKQTESGAILKGLSKDDYLVALDEQGREFSSQEFAAFIQARATAGCKHLVFVIGGAFGLGTEVLERANLTWSLSRLTFPHQLVRLVLAEQVYRACSIIRNEKYHHQ